METLVKSSNEGFVEYDMTGKVYPEAQVIPASVLHFHRIFLRHLHKETSTLSNSWIFFALFSVSQLQIIFAKRCLLGSFIYMGHYILRAATSPRVHHDSRQSGLLLDQRVPTWMSLPQSGQSSVFLW
jgi:hypothetical protein